MSDKLRILIVEDVPADAELIEYELQNAGMTFSAKRVETKAAYVEALSTFLPDVILSDYSLPAFDGMTALQLRLEQAPDTPFIFVTGALGEELAIDLVKQGATDYVLKSRLSRLPVAVNRALREVEERKERERTQAELNRAESELLSHLRFFENMDRINRAMQGTNDLEQTMGDVPAGVAERAGDDMKFRMRHFLSPPKPCSTCRSATAPDPPRSSRAPTTNSRCTSPPP